MNEIYSVKQAAKLMGISEPYLRVLLARGEVKGRKLDGTWLVLDLNYKRQRRPKGFKRRKWKQIKCVPGV